MVFTAYTCEHMKRITVACGGLANGNARADIEIIYKDACMEEVKCVWYKEYGNNPYTKKIGDDIEWGEDDTFKVLKNGEYVDDDMI